jgi:hypothetical protein
MKMKILKLIVLFLGSLFAFSDAAAQANAYINILTQNSGQVPVGGTVNIEVTVGNSGPVSPIGVNKVRAQISVPIAICNILPAQTLPAGWTISAYVGGGSSITVCNGTDVIPVGAARTILISVQGNAIGGPSTVNGNLLFSNGASCTAPGSLPGDNTADNSSTSSIQVIPGCPLTVTAAAGTIACNGGTTTLTATPGGASGAIQYSLNGGAFQAANTFTVNAAGSPYTVVAREVSTPSCTATSAPVTISEPAAVPAPATSVIHPTCTVATGTITITSSTTGLTFSIDSGPYLPYTIPYAVPAGAHTLRAQNAVNCLSAISNITVNAQPVTPAAPTAGTITQPTCTVATGSVVLNGLPAGNWTINPGAITGNTSSVTINNLAAGVYNYTVTNAVGCTSPASANITIDPQPVTPAALTTGTITQPTCTVATGSVVLNGLPSGNWMINPGAITGNTSSATINNLTAGTYNYTVTNSVGCTSAASANITIDPQPVTPAVPTVGTITQPTCAVSTGSVVLNGLPTGNWTINPGAVTGNTSATTINNLAAGTYNYTVTNSVGCTSAASANIVIDPVPGAPAAPTVSVIHPTCTVSTGTITVTSATAGLTFSLDGAPYASYPAGGYTGVAAGPHTLTLQNAASCISPVTNIIVNAQPATPAAPTVSVVHPTCTIAIGTTTVTSATAGLTFSLDGGAYTVYPAGGYAVPAGAHTLTAQNASSCISAVTNITINAQPVTPTAPIVGNITQPTCAVVTGSVVLNDLPSGNWIINPGAISGSGINTTVTGLAPATTYNFTVTNSDGCTSVPSANVVIDPIAGTPPEPAVSVVHPTCTEATGTITVTSSTTGLTFSLDGGAYAAYPAGGYIVAAGAHTLTSQNAANCISPVTDITVNAQPPTPAAPTTSIVHPTCTVATATIIITSATAGLTFSLDGAAYAAYPAGGYVVAAGSHTLSAQNTSSCISAVTNITVNAQPPTPAAPTTSVVHPTCTVATGTITISSATTGLTFSLDGGAYSAYPAGGYVVAAGAHTLTAQNSSNCISATGNITVNVQPPTPAAPTVNVTQPTCSVATGTITITSATGGLTFSLDGGTYSAYPAGGYLVTAGTHTITAQNIDNCISAVTNITVNAQPTTPTATALAGSIACNGGTTTLTVTASGGTTPYQYSLNGATFQAGNTFTVPAGSHTVTIRGANLCTTTTSLTVSQPTAITVAASAGLIACNGGTTTLTATASGGTAPYEYSLNGGAYQSANTFTVGTGIQTVTVRDVNLCTKTATAVTVTQPAILTASANAPRITTCGGKTLVTISAFGGRTPYTGVGTFIKGPGTWNFIVTDAGGCTASTSITIEAPGCMDLEVFPNPARNSINVNHSVAEPGSVMQVFDIKGALLFTKTISLHAFLTTIDISRLHAAVYVLLFINGKDKKSILFEKLSH